VDRTAAARLDRRRFIGRLPRREEHVVRASLQRVQVAEPGDLIGQAIAQEAHPQLRFGLPGPTLVGALAERRVGRMRVFVDAENLGNVRQTRWDPLVRPERRPDGRWTVDAWAPLDGLVVNGGVRVAF
jgi:hypothetical protein